MSYKHTARASSSAKMSKIAAGGSNKLAPGATGPDQIYKAPHGNTVEKAPVEHRIAGGRSGARLDKPHRASGGRIKKGTTNVNITIAPQSQPAAPPMPLPPPPMPPAGGPPMPPPMPAGGPPAPGGAMSHGGRVYRKQGGRVHGAGSAAGRLARSKGDNDGDEC